MKNILAAPPVGVGLRPFRGGWSVSAFVPASDVGGRTYPRGSSGCLETPRILRLKSASRGPKETISPRRSPAADLVAIRTPIPLSYGQDTG